MYNGFKAEAGRPAPKEAPEPHTARLQVLLNFERNSGVQDSS